MSEQTTKRSQAREQATNAKQSVHSIHKLSLYSFSNFRTYEMEFRVPILERAPKPSEEASMARKFGLPRPMKFLLPPASHITPVILLKLFLDEFGLDNEVPVLGTGEEIQSAPWRRLEMGTL